MRQPIILGTGTHYFAFNTSDTAGAPITLAGSPTLRASINGGDYVAAGLTLSVDHDYNGASQVTGLHRVALDIDDATLALVAGDTVDVILNAGTVGGVSRVGTVLWRVVALAAGLTTAEKADVNAEADTAIADAALATAAALGDGTVVLHADYNPAKTAAQAGDEMDLVDAPNATAVTAINAAIAALLASLPAAYGSLTVRAALGKILSMVTGPTSGAGTATETFQKPDDSGPDVVITNDGTNRLTANLNP